MPTGKCPMDEGKLLLNKKRIIDILESIKTTPYFAQAPKKDFSGKSYNVFVGRFNYPHVNVGLLFSEQDNALLDKPSQWAEQNLPIQTLALLRSSLINSGKQAHVKLNSVNDRITKKLRSSAEEIALSQKPLDIEIEVEKPVAFKFTFSGEATPYGPRAALQDISVQENAHVPKPVERIHADTDVKANDAMHELSAKGFDEHYLTKLLSSGQLGTAPQRKMVPTRWAITATDDMLGKRAIAQILSGETQPLGYFEGSYLGNYYFVIAFPGPFRYELFETHVPTGNCGTDFEDVGGRKAYAETTAGGYYAARLAIVEEMQRMGRQASFLVLRFVTEEYFMPLGVWVVREAVRNAMKSPFVEIASKEQLLEHIRAMVMQRFRLDLQGIYVHSRLLDLLKHQKTLNTFM